MSGSVDPHEVWTRLGPAGRIAACLGAASALVLGVTLIPLVRAVFVDSADSQVAAADDATLSKKYTDAFPADIAQIDGRLLFLTPGPPKPPEVSVEPPPVDHPTPQAPNRYEGPAMVGMMSDTVWFDNGKWLTAGGAKDGDLRVVSINPPWDASLEWKGVIFTVPFFGRDSLIVKEPLKTEPKKEEPSEEANKPSVAAVAAATQKSATDSLPPATPSDGPLAAAAPAVPVPAAAPLPAVPTTSDRKK